MPDPLPGFTVLFEHFSKYSFCRSSSSSRLILDFMKRRQGRSSLCQLHSQPLLHHSWRRSVFLLDAGFDWLFWPAHEQFCPRSHVDLHSSPHLPSLQYISHCQDLKVKTLCYPLLASSGTFLFKVSLDCWVFAQVWLWHKLPPANDTWLNSHKESETWKHSDFCTCHNWVFSFGLIHEIKSN